MSTTITVEGSTLERFNTLKAEQNEGNVPEMNADLFLNSLMDTLEAADNGYYTDVTDDDIQEIINRIAAMADDTGAVDSDSMAREIAKQLDYAELANMVANELEVRME